MRAAIASNMLAMFCAGLLPAQTPYSVVIQPSEVAIELPINQGAAAVWQSLKKLHTRASLLMVTAHPDDEDGGMLTYESRGMGARVSLLTLNRGEGGANVMSPEYFDALGLVRTRELLNADRYYGVDQYWTRVIDYGFSKTLEEALEHWTKERVLADAVRIVRMVRPLVITSVFVGGPSDGHGNHQVAGLMAQEVFRAAADPNMFPEQIRAGPFRPVGQALSVNVEIPEGDYDPMLGASYVQVARTGLGEQKTQNGGPVIPAAGKFQSGYHRLGSVLPSAEKETSFFDGIDVSLMGIASLAKSADAAWLAQDLRAINSFVEDAMAKFHVTHPERIAPQLAEGLKAVEALIAGVAASDLTASAKYDISHELRIKQAQFNNALVEALGVSAAATVKSPDTFRMAVPGQKFPVAIHIVNRSAEAITVTKCAVEPQSGESWSAVVKGSCGGSLAGNAGQDTPFEVTGDREVLLRRVR
jgi:LmbE family N-acetylglucosaminyl deacetylase